MTPESTPEPAPAPTTTTRSPLDVSPVDGWFSVKFSCWYLPGSAQEKWSSLRDAGVLVPPYTRRPPGYYDVNDLQGAAHLAIFGAWGGIGNAYPFREKADDRGLPGLGPLPGGPPGGGPLDYTLSTQIPANYPWAKNLAATLAILDTFMGGGCVYERAPVLRDWFKDNLDAKRPS